MLDIRGAQAALSEERAAAMAQYRDRALLERPSCSLQLTSLDAVALQLYSSTSFPPGVLTAAELKSSKYIESVRVMADILLTIVDPTTTITLAEADRRNVAATRGRSQMNFWDNIIFADERCCADYPVPQRFNAEAQQATVADGALRHLACKRFALRVPPSRVCPRAITGVTVSALRYDLRRSNYEPLMLRVMPAT